MNRLLDLNVDMWSLYFTTRAVFTIRDGQTLLSPVEGDTVNLDDIWRPLPSPFERGVVFPHLWQSFTHNREDAR